MFICEAQQEEQQSLQYATKLVKSNLMYQHQPITCSYGKQHQYRKYYCF